MLKSMSRVTIALILCFMCCMISGCKNKETKSLIYNASESTFIAQNSDYYYYNDSDIVAVSKKDDEASALLRDPFNINEHRDYCLMLFGDYLYYYNKSDSTINRLSLSNYINETIYSFTDNNTSNFLGIMLKKDHAPTIKIYNFFTDGENLYFMLYEKDGIFKLNGNKIERTINDKIYDNQFSFNGTKAYYVNAARELICFDMKTYKSEIIETNFANAVYYDGVRILFSDKSGIFSLNTNTSEIKKLSDHYADKISSDGESVVFQCDNTLFYMNGGIVSEIERIDYIQNFAIVANQRKVVVKYYENEIYKVKTIEL